jgi:hypothetical protein
MYKWKTHVKSITEDRGLEGGDWENRLLRKLRVVNPLAGNAKKKKKKRFWVYS